MQELTVAQGEDASPPKDRNSLPIMCTWMWEAGVLVGWKVTLKTHWSLMCRTGRIFSIWQPVQAGQCLRKRQMKHITC
eukprot:1154562-Pelagomonas_calceolata.AAC.4